MANPSDQVVIIGAGPAGLTAAYELVKHGYQPLVVEKDPHYVGGLARTVQFNGFRFDIGGHRFFSKSQEIERLWEEICGEAFIRQPADTSSLSQQIEESVMRYLTAVVI